MSQDVPSQRPSEQATEPESVRRNAFWTPKTIAELAAEQGVRLPQDIDALVGQGADLWESDEDFDRFLASITERRGRDPGPPG